VTNRMRLFVLAVALLNGACEGPATLVTLTNASSRPLMACSRDDGHCKNLLKGQSETWFNPHVPFKPSDLHDSYVRICGRKITIPDLSAVTVQKGEHDFKIAIDEREVDRLCAGTDRRSSPGSQPE